MESITKVTGWVRMGSLISRVCLGWRKSSGMDNGNGVLVHVHNVNILKHTELYTSKRMNSMVS